MTETEQEWCAAASQVAGLWVILGASIGAAILMVVVQNLMYK